MVIANMDIARNLTPAVGLVRAGQDVALSFDLTRPSSDDSQVRPDDVVEGEPVVVPCATGLHARPAAVLADKARSFSSQVRLHRGDREVNAKSVTAVMTLDVGHGDRVRLSAWGPDAEAAVATLTAAIRDGLGETVVATGTGTAPEAVPTPEPDPEPDLLRGVGASPGLAVGIAVPLTAPDIPVTDVPSGPPEQEWDAFQAALERARRQLAELETATAAKVGIYQADIFGAQRQILDDPELTEPVEAAVRSGAAAGPVWKDTYQQHADALSAMANPLLAARGSDIRDVGLRVLAELTGTIPARAELPAGAVLVSRDLTASDTAVLDAERVAAIVLTEGGATSHSSILAQSLGIPAVVGCDPRVLDLAEGSELVVDGDDGTVRIDVPAEELAEVRSRLERDAERRRRNLAAAHQPAVTRDGHRVEVVCNIGSLDDVRRGMAEGAEGVGLLRSEFVFMNRVTAPTEQEQAELYRSVADLVGEGNRLIIRTLDVGGDKPLPYLPMAAEDNPFLGQRGIRVGLEHQEKVLRPQLRAILQAARTSHAAIHVMFPMISTLAEFRGAKAILEEERVRLDAPAVPVGIMVEVPAVAMMAEQFAREVDFFSIGTNDLTQYTMAMDRGHPKLAPRVDALNPGVLALIRSTVQGAHAHGTWVGVCGALASDPRAAAILLGLGVDELSAVISAVADVKAAVRDLDLTRATELAERAVRSEDASAVRDLLPPINA
ncbi:MAG: phosphoenolpyruvate--protein phosphotransferase [Arachnia propionica]|uniref:phosphoenolpyruvate--protein phosphotransferase n=1 Tax=Arachnia propionica TaxID=1750 RepID=UPI00270919C3|nr:phosphoenolpyruvate--protein phosphotransferase [Arachnia propionica]